MVIRPVPYLAVLCALAPAPAVAQSGFSAQWTAVQPIVAQWVNAPIGTQNPIVTWPAGPLPATPLTVAVHPTGPNAQTVFYSSPLPLQSGMEHNWLFASLWWAPYPQVTLTTADLLLQISGPQSATGSIEFRVTDAGDTPDPTGFRIDVGNDGTVEVDTRQPFAPTTFVDRRAAYAWDFANGPLFVRVTHHSGGYVAPQLFTLQVSFRSWVAGMRSSGDDCGAVGSVPVTSGYESHYHLAALPSLSPNHAMVLRATGVGPFASFLVSLQPHTAVYGIPGFLTPPCDLLAPVEFLVAGGVSSVVPGTPFAVEWIAPVPHLPPGLDFYVQHASMNVGWLGMTNRVHVRT
ncbi:MAG: hypothetical protein U1E73_01165 [Planctomycetota bacterium]